MRLKPLVHGMDSDSFIATKTKTQAAYKRFCKDLLYLYQIGVPEKMMSLEDKKPQISRKGCH